MSIVKKFDLLRFLKFCTVGATGTIVSAVLLWLLTEIAGYYYLVSAAISIETAIIVNFTFHSFFTFSDRRSSTFRIFLMRLLKYNLISLVGMFLNMGILWLLTEIFSLYYMLSYLCGILSATVFRYIFNFLWIWKRPAE